MSRHRNVRAMNYEDGKVPSVGSVLISNFFLVEYNDYYDDDDNEDYYEDDNEQYTKEMSQYIYGHREHEVRDYDDVDGETGIKESSEEDGKF